MVGPYRLLGRLGAGGMGQVFLGITAGGRKVAVKLIRPDHIGMAQFRERFTREIEAARRVGGFHTAMVVDADPSADPPWMATAYIQGPSLEDAVRSDGPLGVKEVRELGAGLAEGLAAIHDCGLVHRDLKPGNVILAHDGPRIIDFGIARALGARPVTTPGAVVGTYAYMSPEQVRGHPAGVASDVFSLGSTLAFAVSGRLPFGTEPLEAVLYRITGERPDLRGVPEERQFRRLIDSCLAKAPARRPSLAQILAALVEPASGAEGATQPVDQPMRRPLRPTPSRQPPTAILGGQLPPGRGPRRLGAGKFWAAGTALVVLVVVVLLIHAMQTPAATVPVRLAGVYSAERYGFDMPYGIAVDSHHVWVTNGNSNSVTELSARDGSMRQILSGGHYGFAGPQIIMDDGTHLWVGNAFGNSLTELNASNGAWIRTMAGGQYGFDYPLGIAFDGTNIWVPNFHGNSVTEVNASTGAWVRTLAGGGYRFNQPAGIAVDGTDIWITNISGDSMEELDARNGSVQQMVSGAAYRFDKPNSLVIAGNRIWIGNWKSRAATAR